MHMHRDVPTAPAAMPVESLEPRRLFALSATDVRQILAQAASQAVDASLDKIAIAVVDRDANVLGIWGRSGLAPGAERDAILLKAVARARTAALFQSSENAFSTRSARFIIQDHFPEPIRNTPGGPLYGVQFSNLAGSDIVGGSVVANGPAISGDPGGIPLYRDGVPIGGIGVAGDFADVLAREDLALLPAYDSGDRVFAGSEESDVDEQIALAGAQGFMADESIWADNVRIDGLTLPFIEDEPKADRPFVGLGQLRRRGLGDLIAGFGKARDDAIAAPTSPYPRATFAGVDGILKRQNASLGRDQNYGIVTSNDRETFSLFDERLTTNDVRRVIDRAVGQAIRTRAGIRLPIGSPARVHVAVVDRDGDVLGVFAMDDATNFSFDVAVQKARTAAFFSDDAHAFSTRAIGFLSQENFPIGIDGAGEGPLFQVQNALSPGLALGGIRSGGKNPLPNGITIFPGGVPLYKNGQLVGAVGISGDGVDQDDLIAFAGAGSLGAATAIRSDTLSRESIRAYLLGRTQALLGLFGKKRFGELRFEPPLADPITIDDVADRLDALDFRLPFVKFPRNPEL